ncbi:unnamed protein product [Symbiodinium natans]|uniref:R3H domain-containing protein n=1 Tax=Symbiodinium natans TaxID=878477 RepID=A0A812K4W2_9DINO|nr:unnamed protein product [Symbiodinium natans]
MNNRRTVLCEYWLRSGYCRNGSKCNFAHGATQLRRAEVNAHPEDVQLRKAVSGETPPPAKLLEWREQLASLPPGRQLSFEGLRPTERYALHQLANEFHLTHMSTGVGDQRRLHILKPAPAEASPKAEEDKGRLSRAEQKRRRKERMKSKVSTQTHLQSTEPEGGVDEGEAEMDRMMQELHVG